MKIGIDIGGSHIGTAIVDNLANIITKEETDIDKNHSPLELVEKLNSLLVSLFKSEAASKEEIESIGIGIPGTIKNNKIIHTPNLPLDGFDLARYIEKEFNKPVKIKNDATCATIAEHKFGTLQKSKNGVLLTLGTGIGAGLILNGELYEGSNGIAGEIGHTIIDNGKTFESLSSMKALKSILRQKLNLDDNLSGREVLNILEGKYERISQEEREVIKEIEKEYIKNLSIGISNLIKTLDLDKIVIGGSFVFYKDIFLDKVKDKVKELNKDFETSYNYEIDVAKFYNDAGIIGASQL